MLKKRVTFTGRINQPVCVTLSRDTLLSTLDLDTGVYGAAVLDLSECYDMLISPVYYLEKWRVINNNTLYLYFNPNGIVTMKQWERPEDYMVA